MININRRALAASAATIALLCVAGTPANSTDIKAAFKTKGPVSYKVDTAPEPGAYERDPTVVGSSTSGPSVVLSFEGQSQYDSAALLRNFIPPDTMGAVGNTQYVSILNGSFGVYDKSTGTRLALMSDVSFWANAGLAGTNGDPRIMYNRHTDQWIAVAFGADVKDLQIAVSDTSDALGSWKSVRFEGFAPPGLFDGTADYPTLAFDRNAVYIGTNDFAADAPGGSRFFRGTTLNVIPLDSVFGADGPSVDGLKQFRTPYTGGGGDDFTRGFAIQGVNSDEASSTGNILAVSIAAFAVNRYDILDAGTAGAVRTDSVELGSGYQSNFAARQPDLVFGTSRRAIDALDDRISGSVHEVDGKIYGVHTVTPADCVSAATCYTSVRYYVIDSVTNEVLDEGEISGGNFDYYQGSVAVNKAGQVVIAYNRSGNQAEDGKISIFAQVYNTVDGKLVEVGDALLLKKSLVDDYHNGSVQGSAPAGRQRWGDYSAVSWDPTDFHSFWVIGQYAREWNNAAGGHPGGTGGSRWSTWISKIDAGFVPEPATWAMMVIGFGAVGFAARRQRRQALA